MRSRMKVTHGFTVSCICFLPCSQHVEDGCPGGISVCKNRVMDPPPFVPTAILGMHTLMSNQQYYQALGSSSIVNKEGLNSEYTALLGCHPLPLRGPGTGSQRRLLLHLQAHAPHTPACRILRRQISSSLPLNPLGFYVSFTKPPSSQCHVSSKGFRDLLLMFGALILPEWVVVRVCWGEMPLCCLPECACTWERCTGCSPPYSLRQSLSEPRAHRFG